MKPEPKIAWTNTERGLRIGHFKDRYEANASIQKSSLAFEDCIWLGADDIAKAPGCEPQNRRMHLTRDMAGELARVLQKFADTGELP